MKAVLVLDVDGLRRAHLDPQAFYESLRQAVLNSHGPRTAYASGMVAGNIVWRGPNNENPTLKLDGLRADVINEGKPF